MPTIPSATVSRLVTYLRIVGQLERSGVVKTSSEHLAEGAHVSPYQVRKDLAYFGRFGTRGAGYSVATLHDQLKRILGLDRPWRVAIVGMGRLGQAIADYPNFDQYDFTLEAFFDIDEDKVGTSISGLEISHLRDLARVVAQRKIEIGFITVPQDAAQGAADALVEVGVRGILNFAPTVIDVPDEVRVEPVDFLAGLKRLSFYIQKPQEELHEA